MKNRNLWATIFLAAALGACGILPPQLNEAWEPADLNDELIYRIKKSIYCELTNAIKSYGQDKYVLKGKPANSIPDNWGVQLTLTMTSDETSSLNPSGSYNRNIHPAADPLAPNGSVAQSFSLPFTTQLSSQAVRMDTAYSFFTIKEILRKKPIDTTCHEYNADEDKFYNLDRSGSSLLLSGNVGIASWLKGALVANNALPSSPLMKPKEINLEVLQYSIKFVVITAGSVNPTWKLAPVSTAVGGLPLLSGNRTRTHQLLVTLGPAETEGGKNQPSGQSVSLHSSGQFGQVVGDELRSALGR